MGDLDADRVRLRRAARLENAERFGSYRGNASVRPDGRQSRSVDDARRRAGLRPWPRGRRPIGAAGSRAGVIVSRTLAAATARPAPTSGHRAWRAIRPAVMTTSMRRIFRQFERTGRGADDRRSNGRADALTGTGDLRSLAAGYAPAATPVPRSPAPGAAVHQWFTSRSGVRDCKLPQRNPAQCRLGAVSDGISP